MPAAPEGLVPDGHGPSRPSQERGNLFEGALEARKGRKEGRKAGRKWWNSISQWLADVFGDSERRSRLSTR